MVKSDVTVWENGLVNKVLVYKHRDLSSVSDTHVERGMWWCILVISELDGRDRRTLGSTDRPA